MIAFVVWINRQVPLFHTDAETVAPSRIIGIESVTLTIGAMSAVTGTTQSILLDFHGVRGWGVTVGERSSDSKFHRLHEDDTHHQHQRTDEIPPETMVANLHFFGSVDHAAISPFARTTVPALGIPT